MYSDVGLSVEKSRVIFGCVARCGRENRPSKQRAARPPSTLGSAAHGRKFAIGRITGPRMNIGFNPHWRGVCPVFPGSCRDVLAGNPMESGEPDTRTLSLAVSSNGVGRQSIPGVDALHDHGLVHCVRESPAFPEVHVEKGYDLRGACSRNNEKGRACDPHGPFECQWVFEDVSSSFRAPLGLGFGFFRLEIGLHHLAG